MKFKYVQRRASGYPTGTLIWSVYVVKDEPIGTIIKYPDSAQYYVHYSPMGFNSTTESLDQGLEAIERIHPQYLALKAEWGKG